MSDTLDWNAKTIAEFRAKEGKVGGIFRGAPIVLLHYRGRRRGREHVTPIPPTWTSMSSTPVVRASWMTCRTSSASIRTSSPTAGPPSANTGTSPRFRDPLHTRSVWGSGRGLVGA